MTRRCVQSQWERGSGRGKGGLWGYRVVRKLKLRQEESRRVKTSQDACRQRGVRTGQDWSGLVRIWIAGWGHVGRDGCGCTVHTGHLPPNKLGVASRLAIIIAWRS